MRGVEEPLLPEPRTVEGRATQSQGAFETQEARYPRLHQAAGLRALDVWAEISKWPRWTGFRGKTAWDWMDLLIVPLALVVIGLGFTMLQDARQQDLENQRAQQAQRVKSTRRCWHL